LDSGGLANRPLVTASRSRTGCRRIANPLSGLSRWKILDNLRRSLVPSALLLLLLANWMLIPELGGLGSLLFVAMITMPALLSAVVESFANLMSCRSPCI